MDCMTIPVIAALAASGVPISTADAPSAPRGAITIAQLDETGEIVSERSQSCSSLTGCLAPVQIGRVGLDRIRLIVRPDGASGMHVHAVIEDGRGREFDAPAQRLCWRSTGMARGELQFRPLREPGPTQGLRLSKIETDSSAEPVTLAIAITPGL